MLKVLPVCPMYFFGHSIHFIWYTGHAYGTTTDTMEIITTGKKGKHLNTLERYYIYIKPIEKTYK
jgi:hypothetical protein